MKINAPRNCFVIGLLVLAGCNGSATKPTVQVAAVTPVDQSLPEIAHPEYANWSKFPVNSYVVRKRVVTNDNGRVDVTQKIWLESKTDAKVGVASQTTVERSDQATQVNPSDLVNFPATFRLPKDMTQEQFYVPSPKAKKTGEEKVKIGDQEFDTIVYEWTENNEAGPMNVKLWRSDDVPGRIVKQEMLTKSSNTSHIESVIEVDLTGKATPGPEGEGIVVKPSSDK